MKIVLIVQGRLGSSRLQQKALLPFGNSTLLEHVLTNLKCVQADEYYLATDYNSYDAFLPIANQCDFKIFQGPENDVLERFCMVVKECNADIVIRATADNPFLFSDAANYSLQRFLEIKKANAAVDYFTLSSMPHGSGVEVFDAKQLLKAASETDSPYDHEHVGPAFYNHKDKYACVFEPAPQKWNFPDFRITVDTYADYQKALRMLQFLQKSTNQQNGFSSEQIIALKNEPCIENPVLFIPSIEKGHGTGHLRRCLDLAQKLDAYILLDQLTDKKTQNTHLENIDALVSETTLSSSKIIKSIEELSRFSDNNPNKPFSLVVVDYFVSNTKTLATASALGSVLALDEGNCNRLATDQIDYLLDIIPSKKLKRTCNLKDSSFITLPKNKKSNKLSAFEGVKQIKTALVCIGGEDPAGFSIIAESALQKLGLVTTLVNSQNPIPNLKEELYKYDLVVTHYGFTAFEAVAAGCAVLTVATTKLHKYLSKTEGFVCATKKDFANVNATKKLLEATLRGFTPTSRASSLQESTHLSDLATFIEQIAVSKKIPCPVCRNLPNLPTIVYRNEHRTIKQCPICYTKYLALETKQTSAYQENYFFDDYKKQYGKTYLEDFESIKSQGKRRLENIKKVQKLQNLESKATLLDIGCAYGPFVQAAKETGFQPTGTDISVSATDYVSKELGIPSFSGDFTKINFDQKFDIITMWYVIEHFENLSVVLKKVNELLNPNGNFAFSTPSGNGISAKKNAQGFYKSSPADHFSIWTFKSAQKVLKMHGFKICKIVSTGHHPERFFKNGLSPKKHPLLWNLVLWISKLCKLGDTFEVYARKIKNYEYRIMSS